MELTAECDYSQAKSSNWSKRGQCMNSPWNVITYGLRVQIGQNEGQCGMNSRWNVITHKLRVQIDRNEVSMESTADGM